MYGWCISQPAEDVLTLLVNMNFIFSLRSKILRNVLCYKPGFHIVLSVVSVVSVVRKKLIGQIQLYGNLPYKCSVQKKWQIQLVVVRDRRNSICSMNFFSYHRHDRYDRYNDMETRLYGAYIVATLHMFTEEMRAVSDALFSALLKCSSVHDSKSLNIHAICNWILAHCPHLNHEVAIKCNF